MSIHDIAVTTLDGRATTLNEFKGQALLIVNVASKCGLTPQYTALEDIQRRYQARGFSVLGFPCNQFGGQEPGSNDEIATFCSTTYGVTFPMFDKVDVNGAGRHALYDELTKTADAEGHTGDIRWNFEKFLVGPDGTIVARFSPLALPDGPEVTGALEQVLPG